MTNFSDLTGKDNYFEDFVPGVVMRHARGKTIETSEHVMVTNLAMNSAQGHFNEEAAKATPFGQRMTFRRLHRGACDRTVLTGHVRERSGRAEPQQDPFWHAGFRAATRIIAFTEVLAVSDADDASAGIVHFKHWGVNQDDKVVFEGERKVLVKRRGAQTMTTEPHGALEGLRIIDLTQMLAGPFCTMMLADQGAEVIKVEPFDGDYVRFNAPFHPDDKRAAYGGYFASVNRNKKSIAIDLKTEEGRDIVIKLCRDADAVVENYRVGVMDRLGLSLRRPAEPRTRALSTPAIRGFGDPSTGRSPYADWQAYDVVAQAIGGVIGINGPDGLRR